MVKNLTVDIVLIGDIGVSELGQTRAGIDGRDPAEVVGSIPAVDRGKQIRLSGSPKWTKEEGESLRGGCSRSVPAR